MRDSCPNRNLDFFGEQLAVDAEAHPIVQALHEIVDACLFHRTQLLAGGGSQVLERPEQTLVIVEHSESLAPMAMIHRAHHICARILPGERWPHCKVNQLFGVPLVPGVHKEQVDLPILSQLLKMRIASDLR